MKMYGDNRDRTITPQNTPEYNLVKQVKLLKNTQNTLLKRVKFWESVCSVYLEHDLKFIFHKTVNESIFLGVSNEQA